MIERRVQENPRTEHRMDTHGQLNRTFFIPLFDWRDKRRRLRHVKDIESFNSLSREEIRDAQWRSLMDTIKHAYEHVPFYRRRLRDADLSLGQIQAPSDLTRIPELTRDDIRSHGGELLAEGLDRQTLVRTATGGTTSSPVDLYLDPQCLDLRQAATIAFNKWFGYNLGDKAVWLWGAAQDFPQRAGIAAVKTRIRNYLTSRIVWLPSSYLDDAIMAEYYNKLCRYKPKVIQAYPTPLYLFAKYLAERNLTYRPETITVAAEHLYDYQREQIESVFRCRVFNWYGARELGHIASECREHHGMHINAYHLFVEVIADGKQVVDKEGTLVITDMRNPAMPLIRYNIGDIGMVSHRECACGSYLPILEDVSGRLVDTFVTPEGARVPGVALTNRIIGSCTGIEKMQVVQKTPARFVIRIVKGQTFSDSDITELEESMRTFFRTELDLGYEYVDDIPVTKSGKSRFCISEVACQD